MGSKHARGAEEAPHKIRRGASSAPRPSSSRGALKRARRIEDLLLRELGLQSREADFARLARSSPSRRLDYANLHLARRVEDGRPVGGSTVGNDPGPEQRREVLRGEWVAEGYAWIRSQPDRRQCT